jgi:hypothetical protein
MLPFTPLKRMAQAVSAFRQKHSAKQLYGKSILVSDEEEGNSREAKKLRALSLTTTMHR